jgi:hypothetical protein
VTARSRSTACTVARELIERFGGPIRFGGVEPRDPTAADRERLEALREAIRDKNLQFFYRFRPVNAEYVVGRRVEPFGSVNFPGEMKQLDAMVAERDKRIHALASKLRDVEVMR